jgi:hypothetical protein
VTLRRAVHEVAREGLLARGGRDDRVPLSAVRELYCAQRRPYAGELGDSRLTRRGKVVSPVDGTVRMPDVLMAVDVQKPNEYGPLAT